MRDSNLLRAMFSAGVMLGFFAVLEGALRLQGEDWSELYQGDPGYDWRLKANLDLPAVPHLEEERTFSVRTNPEGLRDDPIPSTGPWILALGCSTTFGWGVQHEEAWTEVLEGLLDVPVVNAGIPGHSTHQGMALAASLLEQQPTAVILGWGLRDAQLTTLPDADRRPATFPRNTQLYRMLASFIAPSSEGSIPRVSAAAFQRNLASVIEMATGRGIGVLILDMTGRSDTPEHGAGLQQLGHPLVVPELTDAHHFAADPIHMNVSGNQALAMQLSKPVRKLIEPKELPPPTESGPPQTP